MAYTAVDYCRMMWRNADGVIRCLQAGEVDGETAEQLTLRLCQVQDFIAKTVAIIRDSQGQPVTEFDKP